MTQTTLPQRTLKDFFQDIQNWIDQGCPFENEYYFLDGVGLCTNLNEWLECRRIIGNHMLLLIQDFEGKGLDTAVPFGYTARHKYQILEDYLPHQQREVETRLAYIKEKLK